MLERCEVNNGVKRSVLFEHSISANGIQQRTLGENSKHEATLTKRSWPSFGCATLSIAFKQPILSNKPFPPTLPRVGQVIENNHVPVILNERHGSMRTDETVSTYGHIQFRGIPVRRIVPFMFADSLIVLFVGNESG